MSDTTVNQGIETTVASTNRTMRSRAFRLGYEDFVAGKPLPADIVARLGEAYGAADGGDWDYERGRLYAAAGGDPVRMTATGRFVSLRQRRFYDNEEGIL